MTTQTLRGLATHGPMHWRGDRTGATFPSDPLGLDEQLAFEAFNVAFDGLLGRDEGPIPAADMTAFADFILARYACRRTRSAPSTTRSTRTQAERRATRTSIGPAPTSSPPCNGCHVLDRVAGLLRLRRSGDVRERDPGVQGRAPAQRLPEGRHVRHARRAVPQRRRHRSTPAIRSAASASCTTAASTPCFHFLHATVFFLSDADRDNLEQFIFAFDTRPRAGRRPAGDAHRQQRGHRSGRASTLLIARAQTQLRAARISPGAQECDLVVKGTVGGEPRGYLLDPASGQFRSDRAAEAPLGDAALRALAASPGQELTYTCAPPGSGTRMALDRDEDGFFDSDELDAGTDPADPASYPGRPGRRARRARQDLQITNRLPEDEARTRSSSSPTDPASRHRRRRAARRSALRPGAAEHRAGDAEHRQHRSGQAHETDLPCGNWQPARQPANPKGYGIATASSTTARRSSSSGRPASCSRPCCRAAGSPTSTTISRSACRRATVSAVLQSGAHLVVRRLRRRPDADGSDGRRFSGRACAGARLVRDPHEPSRLEASTVRRGSSRWRLLFAGLSRREPGQRAADEPRLRERDFTGWLVAGTSAATIAGAETGSAPTEGLSQAF